MIPPSQQWCHMIDVTSACHLACSNCTRVLGHTKPYFMTAECFERAVIALKDFPYESEPDAEKRPKIVGIIGGEPTLHPHLPALIDIMIEHIPDMRNRGFWTARDWKTESAIWGPILPQVQRLIGHGDDSIPGHMRGRLNWNMHLPSMRVHHSPVLVASREAVPNRRDRWDLIEQCWLQEKWSSTITPNGFYFCEVAGHLDMVLGDGSLGLPIEEGAWRGDLYFEEDSDGVRQPKGRFAEQVLGSCERCGMCLNLPGRLDSDEIDDVSPGNLVALQAKGSRRVRKGENVRKGYRVLNVQVEVDRAKRSRGSARVYVKGARHADQSEAAKLETLT